MKITKRMLQAKGACEDQVQLFARLFPQGVEPTVELCAEHVSDFDWGWAAAKMLPPLARAEYERVMATARAEYERVRASARAEYGRVKATTFGWLAAERSK